MKKLKGSLLFITLILISTVSFSYNSDPKIFIKELVDDAIVTLSDKNISISDKKKKLKLLLLRM